MKTLIQFTLFFFFATLFVSCFSALKPSSEELVAIGVINNTGAPNCSEGALLKIGFTIESSENASSGGIILNPGAAGPVNLVVEDGESVTVEVRRQDNDELLARDRVQIWTESRVASFEDEVRTITYCDGEEIDFDFF